MLRSRTVKAFAPLLLALLLTLAPHLTSAQDTAPEAVALASTFTYQGYLEQGGIPLTTTCDMQFSLFDAVSAGAQIGATLTRTNIAVSSGVFNAPLNFGGTAFNGEDRYLAISVRCPAGAGAYTPLTPRQPITPAPYAMALYGLRTETNAFSPNVIGGYSGNNVRAGVHGATIAGGGILYGGNRVLDDFGTIGGGTNNQVGDVAFIVAQGFETVGGGTNNTANGYGAVVDGGDSNQATNIFAAIGGGYGNTASASYATIGGGGRIESNPATGNRVTDNYGTIGGGGNNQAGDAAGTGEDRQFATVGGGSSNTASGARSTVGGGLNNIASNLSSTIAGGQDNRAAGGYDAIGGGWGNETNNGMATIGGGFYNEVNGQYGTVSGGYTNQANGTWSSVAGGSHNTVGGDYSFAAGNRSTIDAAHDYAFVWSGTSDAAGTQSFGANTFTARAPGGVRFYSAGTGTTIGVELAAGAGAWSSLSDRDAKANFSDVDTRAVLDALVSLPVTTWNYLAQDESIRHIGVMAQDFYAAFNVGEDERHITTIDADGVLFAAVQGLNAKLEAENAALRDQNADLEARVARLEALADVGAQHAAPFPIGLLLLVGGLAGVWWARRR
jgi:hypothetical protein